MGKVVVSNVLARARAMFVVVPLTIVLQTTGLYAKDHPVLFLSILACGVATLAEAAFVTLRHVEITGDATGGGPLTVRARLLGVQLWAKNFASGEIVKARVSPRGFGSLGFGARFMLFSRAGGDRPAMVFDGSWSTEDERDRCLADMRALLGGRGVVFE